MVVFSRSPKNHISHAYEVLRLFLIARVMVNLMECRFYTEIIDYHGHISGARHFEIASHTTDAKPGSKGLTKQKRLFSFFVLFNVPRRFEHDI